MDREASWRITENATDLAKQGAVFFVESAQAAITEKGAFYVALSGGSTPRSMHRMLAQSPYRDEVNWKAVHLFWVDERCVSFKDPGSNFGTAGEDLISKIPVPEDRIHPMPATMVPEEGARAYENELKQVPASISGLPRFDVVFLGIGSDGHTASLFPGQQALAEKQQWVLAVKGGNPDVYRLTLTLPVLNEARHIVFLASGIGKASIVKAVLGNGKGDLPAERISPVHGRLTWFMDKEASSLLMNDDSYEQS